MHPFLKPLPSAEEVEAGPSHPVDQEGDGNNEALVDKYKRWNLAMAINIPNSESEEGSDRDKDEDGDEETEVVDMEENEDGSSKKMCKEEMASHLHLLREFCNGIEYQLKFQDPRFLKTLEKEGGRFFRLARNCLSRERRLNSSRTPSPATWEKSTSNALFYRARPCDDRGTDAST